MPKLVFDIGVFVISTLAKGGVGAFLLKVTGVTLLSTLTSKLFGPKIPNVQARLAGHSVMVRSGVEYRRVVYGKASISGPVVYQNVAGTNNQDLWFMVALCDGEIEELTNIYVDSVAIPAADIAWTPGVGGAAGSGTGAVSNAFTADGNKGLYAWYGLGHANQVSLSPMVTAFTEWTTNHRLRGIAYVALKCIYNETTEKAWQAGAPQNIKAIVKGRRVYDPRYDSTRTIDDTTSPITTGSGSQRITDETTWEWSENPALCVADYLYTYMDVAAANIDWISVAMAAYDCEVQVNIPPTGTQARFTCNGVLSMGDSHKDNLDKLLSAMDGKLTYVAGTWKVRASVWEASSVTFTASDLAGEVQVRGSAPKSERSNKVRGVFVDPQRAYEVVEFPPISSSTYLTRDNSKVITKDLELPMTNHVFTAQRLAWRLLKQDNEQILVKATFNTRGAKCTVGDVVTLELDRFGWGAGKTFRVLEWQRNANGTHDITMREETSATYTDPTTGEYGSQNAATVTQPSETVPPPSSLSATSVPYAIRLNWTNPATQEFDYIDVYASDTSAWSGASKIASVRTDTYTHALAADTTKYYWIRARRNNGDVSTRVPNSDTSTVTSSSGSVGGGTISLAGATLSDEQVAAVTEVAYRLTSGGEEESYEGSPPSPIVWSTIGTWLLSGAAANFDARLTKSSGTDPTSGTLNTWQALSTTRTWIWTDSTQDDSAVSFTGTIEIRDNTTSPATVLGSATVTLTINSQNESISLSGTSGSPNLASHAVFAPETATAGWTFNSDGTVDKFPGGQFAAGVQWVDVTPTGTYYIRATLDSGSSPGIGTVGSWLALSSNRTWSWTQSTNGSKSGVLKIEIADDSSPIGSNILATGYYKGQVSRTIDAPA